MKKIYATLSLFSIAFAAFSQGQNTHDRHEGSEVPGNKLYSTQIKAGGGFTEWYNYGSEIYDFGGNVDYFRLHLWPDSTVLVEFSSGLDNPWKHSIGQVFDPYSAFFEVNHPPVSGSYSVDSIAIPYRYFRFENGDPDTLLVQIYESDKITTVEDPGWTSGASYATLDYDYMTNKGVSPDVEHTILLSTADTATELQNIIYLPVGITVPDSQQIAVTYSFRPGNPYNFGDTIDVYLDPPPTTRRNTLLMYEFRDNDKNVEPGVYNNALTATTDVRYNINANGWNGNYIAGTAWQSGFYNVDTWFLVSNPPGFNSVEESVEKLNVKVYPNPTDNVLNVALPDLSESVQYTLVNALGQAVMTGNFANTNNQIDIARLEAGLYSLTILSGDKLHSQKISKL